MERNRRRGRHRRDRRVLVQRRVAGLPRRSRCSAAGAARTQRCDRCAQCDDGGRARRCRRVGGHRRRIVHARRPSREGGSMKAPLTRGTAAFACTTLAAAAVTVSTMSCVPMLELDGAPCAGELCVDGYTCCQGTCQRSDAPCIGGCIEDRLDEGQSARYMPFVVGSRWTYLVTSSGEE